MLIVAVTGPDGSGKSTACRGAAKLLEARMGEGRVAQVSVWDAIASSGLFTSKKDVVAYLGDLDGATRTLFLFHALSRAIDVAARKNPKVMLVEGHWYKYAVTEIAQGVSREMVLGAASAFKAPSRTVFIEVDAEEAWARKQGKPSEYEQELMKFQDKLAPLWQELENKFGPWQHVSGMQSPEAVAQAIADACLGAL